MLITYEATRDLPLTTQEVETPICRTIAPTLKGKKFAVVPILRAGLGLVDGVLRMVPTARVGHIGMFRDEETLEPHVYFCKMPKDIAERDIMIVDPMLATGSSMELAFQALMTKGHPRHIHLACVIATDQAIESVRQRLPEDKTTLWTCDIDHQLNENSYIIPGLGDAGDLIYGEKE